MAIDKEPDDPLFEHLLHEALGGPSPPDLSESILAALDNSAATRGNSAAKQRSGRGRDATAWNGPAPQRTVVREQASRWGTSSVVALATAICLLCIGYFFWADSGPAPKTARQVAPDASTPQRPSDPPESPSPTVIADAPSNAATGAGPTATETSRGKISLPLPNFSPHPLDSPSADGIALDPGPGTRSPARPAAPQEPLEPVWEDRQIVTWLDEQLAAYWKEQGIAPTAEVSESELGVRLAAFVGAPIDPQADSRLAAIRKGIASEPARAALSQRLASLLLGPVGQRQISPPQREAFARYLEPLFDGSVGYDQRIAGLLAARGGVTPGDDQFHPAAVWLGALAGARSVPLVEQFGHAFLNIDLKCGRCHDHPLDGRVWQDDYWQLTAVFETGLRWSAGDKGALRVESATDVADDGNPVLFYELADGRQRAAVPRIPASWVDVRSSEKAPLDSIAEAMAGNPQLARATVNRAWEIVFGQPLIGSGADPIAAPESQRLAGIQEKLAQQLRAHSFDFGRLLSWVAASQPMRLEAAPSFLWPEVESASPEQLSAAIAQTRAFASFPRIVPPQPLDRLLVTAQRGIGATESLVGGGGEGPGGLPPGTPASSLAQIQEQPSNERTSTAQESASGKSRQLGTAEQVLRATLDASLQSESGSTLPVAWLGKVHGDDRFRGRAEHLYYLAGYWLPSGKQMEIAKSLRDSAGNDDEALRRLWWVLSHEAR